jgi:hypothetical protein
MKRHLYVLISAIIIMFCSGCANMVRGTTEPITIESPNCPGAVCTLQNKKGTWTVTTPGSIVIPRSDDPLKITCEKDGQTLSVIGDSGVSTGAVVGDALLFGIFSGINAATDAHREYPDIIVVPITCE